MNIQGIGTDIIEIKRIEQTIQKYGYRFLDRIFTSEEQEYCLKYRQAARHFAGRFAAKEAIAKALGTGFGHGLGWLDIEIINSPLGKPEVILSERLIQELPTHQISLSISHCHEYATAFAIYTT